MNIKRFFFMSISVSFALMIYSFWYFFYYNFSLKINPEELSNKQIIYNLTYWIIMFATIFVLFVLHCIFIVKIRKNYKKQIHFEKDYYWKKETQKNMEMWIFSFIIFGILCLFISIFNLVFYNSVKFLPKEVWDRLLFVIVHSVFYTILTLSPIIWFLVFWVVAIYINKVKRKGIQNAG